MYNGSCFENNWAKKFQIFLGHHEETSDGHIFRIEDLFINPKPSLKEFLKNALRSKGKICKKSEQLSWDAPSANTSFVELCVHESTSK